MKTFIRIIFVCLLLTTFTISAQDDLAPVLVEIEAEDGLLLIGDYWALNADSVPEDGAVAVLLLHILSSQRSAWEPLIAPLTEAGYHVLAVDMRGHGDTGGERDWDMAETDVQHWLDWLKAQPDTRGVAIVGGSIGSNLALIGCANDPDCLTPIALSPGLDYRGVMPETAVVDGLIDRPVLLIAAHGDTNSANSVREMATKSRGEIAIRIYTDNAHATHMFMSSYAERLLNLIIEWLDEHTS
jgi:pimeloyl-ACP methyl ester carboxylesterase